MSAGQGTFSLLLVFIDAVGAYASPSLADELLPAQVAALQRAGVARPKSFLLLVHRNWEVEYVARRIPLPDEVHGLARMTEGQAVDRMLGFEDDAGRWRPGVAGLQQAEARVVYLRVVERRSVAEVAWALGVRERTVVNHMTEAKRKLRRHLGVGSPQPEGVPSGAGRAMSSAALVAS